MAKSGKTYKALKKRVYKTKNGSKSGKIMRDKPQNRKQRFARATNKKDTNSDNKSLKLAKVESRKIKKLI